MGGRLRADVSLGWVTASSESIFREIIKIVSRRCVSVFVSIVGRLLM